VVGRALLNVRTAALLVAALALAPAYAGPDRDERKHFDEIVEHYDRRANKDAARLRASLLQVDRVELDDERWIDLHVALMHLAASRDRPDDGLPRGVSNPAASSTDPFDQRCHGRKLRPCGEAAYAHKLRTTHGLDMSTMRVLRMGRRARADVQLELELFAKVRGDGETWHEMAEREREDRPTSIWDLRTRYVRFTEEATRFAVEQELVTVPEAALDLKVTLQRRFRYPFAIYSPGPGHRAGTTGSVVLGEVPEELDATERTAWFSEFNDHFQRVVAIHEGVPGHHLQFTRAASVFRGMRRRAYNSVYVEGWGLYCEGMLARHGYLKDPLDQFAAIRLRAWRAVRCYVDPALHSGLIRPSDAVRLLREEAGFSRRAAEMEVERYLGTPTQPIGYWVGRQAIERMRAGYLTLHGADKEREFHDRLLGFGAVPLPLAAAVLLEKRDVYDALHRGD